MTTPQLKPATGFTAKLLYSGKCFASIEDEDGAQFTSATYDSEAMAEAQCRDAATLLGWDVTWQ